MPRGRRRSRSYRAGSRPQRMTGEAGGEAPDSSGTAGQTAAEADPGTGPARRRRRKRSRKRTRRCSRGRCGDGSGVRRGAAGFRGSGRAGCRPGRAAGCRCGAPPHPARFPKRRRPRKRSAPDGPAPFASAQEDDEPSAVDPFPEPPRKPHKRVLTGNVVSDKAVPQSIVVSIARRKKHSLYKKYLTVTRKREGPRPGQRMLRSRRSGAGGGEPSSEQR